MEQNFNNLRYDSCVSNGLCSINPRTSSLQAVMLVYLTLSAKYVLKLYEKNFVNNDFENLILNSLALIISSSDNSEENFMNFAGQFNAQIKFLKQKYEILYNEDFPSEDKEKIETLQTVSQDVLSSIKFGEKVINKLFSELNSEIRNLYNIMLIVIRNMSINLITLKSYKKNSSETFIFILKILNYMRDKTDDIVFLKKEIVEGTVLDNLNIKTIREYLVSLYGEQSEAKVSFSTTPSKAILVVGTNLVELEKILVKLSNTNIDVYTHGGMILAYTFPKFREYKNLKGQYGMGDENCLFDFSTFPGPIVLTKNSIHNVENLYRGQLYTTDNSYVKGVIKIENDDYSTVIDAAIKSKGFKTGKKCEETKMGFNFKQKSEKIDNKIKTGNYKSIVFINYEQGEERYRSYFEKIVKQCSSKVLIVSFGYDFKGENIININSCFDIENAVRVVEEAEKYKMPTTFFIPKCDRNMISYIIYLSQRPKLQIYLGEHSAITLNPALMEALKKMFSIKTITTPKNDFECIQSKLADES